MAKPQNVPDLDEEQRRLLRQRMQGIYPGIDLDAIEKGERQLTAKQDEDLDRIIKEIFRDAMIRWIDASTLSVDGKSKISTYAKKHLR